MPITRKDVKKALFYSAGTATSSVRARPSGSKSPTKRPVLAEKVSKNAEAGVSSRPKRIAQVRKGPEVLNLDRLTSDQFLAELGEGPSSEAIDSQKTLTSLRKQENSLRLRVLTNLNGGILNADAVELDTTSTSVDAENTVEVDTTISTLKTCSALDLDTSTGCAAEDSTAAKPINESIGAGSSLGIDNSHAVDLEISESKAEEKPHDPKEQKSHTENDGTTIESCHKEVQTPTLHYLCMCAKCQQVVGDFITIIQTGSSQHCESKSLSAQQEPPAKPIVINSEQEFVPLYKGSKLKVSVTTKMQLKSIKTNLVKDYINVIMNGLYSEVQMANMTAMGRTKGAECMNDDVRSAIGVYLNHKFEESIDAKEINEAINSKCYACRRKLWNKDNKEVRKPLAKKGPSPNTFSTGEEKKKKKKKKKDVTENKERTKASEKQKVKTATKETSKLKEKPSNSSKSKLQVPHTSFKCKKSAVSNLTKSKNAEKSLSHRPLTGGKRPKSAEDLMKVSVMFNDSFESVHMHNTSTPLSKKKRKRQESSDEESSDSLEEGCDSGSNDQNDEQEEENSESSD